MAEYLLFLFAQFLRRRDWRRFANFSNFLASVKVRHFPVMADDAPMFSIITSKFDYYSDEIDPETGRSIRSSYYRSMETRISNTDLPPIIAMVADCFLQTRSLNIIPCTTDPRIKFIILSSVKGHRDSYGWDYHRQKLADLPQDSLVAVLMQFSYSSGSCYQGLQLLGLPINLSVYSTCQDPLLMDRLIGEYQQLRRYDQGDYTLFRQLLAKSYQVLENRLAGIKTPIELAKGDWQAMIQTVEDWRCYAKTLQNRDISRRSFWSYYDFVLGSQFVSIEELLSRLSYSGWVKEDFLRRDPQVADWIVTERSFLRRYLALSGNRTDDLIYQLVLSFCCLKENWVHLPYFFPARIDQLTPEKQELFWIYQARSEAETFESDLSLSVLDIVQQHAQLLLDESS